MLRRDMVVCWSRMGISVPVERFMGLRAIQTHMVESNHYCVDCGWHFRVDPERHIEIEHDGWCARIVENGDWRDWKRRGGLGIDDR